MLVAVAGFAAVGFNKLRTADVGAEEALGGIDVQLTRRADLIPNLVNTVKGYAAHEKSVFEEVTRARAGLQAAAAGDDVHAKAAADAAMQRALVSLNAVAENYPDLQANENFLDLQRQLADTENQLSFARQYYNDAVAKLNTLVRTLPWLLFTGIAGVQKREFYDAPAGQEVAPQVSFDTPAGRSRGPGGPGHAAVHPPADPAAPAATCGSVTAPADQRHRRPASLDTPASRRPHRRPRAPPSSAGPLVIHGGRLRSEHVERPVLHADARAGGGDLGDGVLPGALAGAAHHEQVAVAHRDGQRRRRRRGVAGAAGAGRRGTRWRPWCLAVAAADAVAVPGDAVAAVAVEAAAGRHERLAELVARSAPTARRAPASRTGWGSALAGAVGVHEAGHVDDAVVHLPALGPPRHVGRPSWRRRRRRRRSQSRRTSTQAPRVSGRRSRPEKSSTSALVGAVGGEEGRLEVHPTEAST